MSINDLNKKINIMKEKGNITKIYENIHTQILTKFKYLKQTTLKRLTFSVKTCFKLHVRPPLIF